MRKKVKVKRVKRKPNKYTRLWESIHRRFVDEPRLPVESQDSVPSNHTAGGHLGTRYELTDAGNAQRFAEHSSGAVRYNWSTRK